MKSYQKGDRVGEIDPVLFGDPDGTEPVGILHTKGVSTKSSKTQKEEIMSDYDLGDNFDRPKFMKELYEKLMQYHANFTMPRSNRDSLEKVITRIREFVTEREVEICQEQTPGQSPSTKQIILRRSDGLMFTLPPVDWKVGELVYYFFKDHPATIDLVQGDETTLLSVKKAEKYK